MTASKISDCSDQFSRVTPSAQCNSNRLADQESILCIPRLACYILGYNHAYYSSFVIKDARTLLPLHTYSLRLTHSLGVILNKELCMICKHHVVRYL